MIVETKFSGSIDLTRRLDLEDQEEIDDVVYNDKLDNANYQAAFREALKQYGYKIDNSGYYVDVDGNRVKAGEYEGEYRDKSYHEIAEATLAIYKIRNRRSGLDEAELSEDDYKSIKRRVMNSFEYDYLKQPEVKQIMYHYDNGNIEGAAHIAFIEWRKLKEGGDIEEWRRFNNTMYDLKLYKNEEFEKYYWEQIDFYNEDVSK